jgi:hypothetical protein
MSWMEAAGVELAEGDRAESAMEAMNEVKRGIRGHGVSHTSTMGSGLEVPRMAESWRSCNLSVDRPERSFTTEHRQLGIPVDDKRRIVWHPLDVWPAPLQCERLLCQGVGD